MMKKLLKIAALILLGVIAIKLAFGLLALAIGLVIPLAVLCLVGLIVWKLIGGQNIWQKLTNKPQTKPYVAVPPAWESDNDLTSYENLDKYIERKQNTSIKH
ncbi:MAG: hypothetical protein HY819_20195 [Acidobacteria bacterium]|nr:hypothetical protein [Acidobacteriota bacterium]